MYIWKAMRICGVCEKMVQAARSTLHGAKCMLHIDGEVREVPMENGSGQGTILGPLFSGFCLLPIMELWVAKWNTAATIVQVAKPESSSLPPPPTEHYCDWDPDLDHHPIYVNNFADDTSTVNKNKQSSAETSEDFIEYMGDFGLTIHVGTVDKPNSKTVIMFFPCNKRESETQNQDPIALSNGTFIPCVQSTVYLGHTITSDLKDEAHLNVRGIKAAQVYGALGPHLMRCRHVWKEVKRLVFVSMILPTMLDGIECCVLTKKGVDELTTVYHRMVRSSVHVTPFTQHKYKLTSEELLSRLDLHPLHHYIDLKVLGYAGHIQRMDERRLPRMLRDGDMEGKNVPGGQHKTHAKTVTQSLMRKGITDEEWKELAVQKDKWRAFIQEVKNPSARITGALTRTCEPWETHPDTIIGRQVQKLFAGGKWHRGTVTSTDVDEDTNTQMWLVKYDDGDREDYSARELAAVLVSTESEDEDAGSGRMSSSSDSENDASKPP